MKTKQTPLEMRDNFVSFSNLEKPSVTQSLSKAGAPVKHTKKRLNEIGRL